MAATKDSPIIFYDVASRDNTPWSANTYRTRLALTLKGLPFRVEYLSYPDIEPTMKKLGASPGAPGATRPWTVPVIADPSSESGGKPTYVSDSWNIAIYLERTYPPPKYPALFPHNSIALHRAMTTSTLSRAAYSDLADTAVSLVGINHMLDDRGHEYFMRTREEAFGKPLTEVLKDKEAKWTTNVRNSWAQIAHTLSFNGPMEEVGPLVMGKQISNSDLVIASLIIWLRRAEGPGGWRWKELLEWDDGRWGLIWKAAEELEAKSTEV